MQKQRTYFCIDMKSFFASVECAERGYNPFTTNLVVADASRGKGALCLAITPKMKSLGIKNRCRLFEIPDNVNYEIAKPRMKKYIDYAADIYEIYLQYMDSADIHVYSIDECFIDATDYLRIYKKTAKEFVRELIDEIGKKLRIPATAGIGTNLYLAKVALDITAKKIPDHIGYLDEKTYQDTLWEHKPITDFWHVAKGTARRLEKYGVTTMKGVAHLPEDLLYKEFGINAELLIDHAWGRESCTMADIKKYKSKSQSVSNSQILFSDYTFEKARLVMDEMVLNGCHELMRRHLITNHVSIGVGYSKETIAPTQGSARMYETTSVYSILRKYALELFDKTCDRQAPIRRLSISFNNVVDECCEGYDLFTDMEAVEKEKRTETAVLQIQDKYGKNALIRAMDLEEGATAIMRNKQIGGHNSE